MLYFWQSCRGNLMLIILGSERANRKMCLPTDRCAMPLGLQDKRLRNGLMSASTYYNHHLAPWHGRLNHRWSWSARHRNSRQWLQFNFVEPMKIKGVATQGRQDANQWVKRYTLSYSMDGMRFRNYRERRRVKVGMW